MTCYSDHAIVRHSQTVLGNEFILRIWRQLSTPQRMHLLAMRRGRIGDVSLGDIERVRRTLPEAGAL